jgi:ABC-type glycerol-3-phosphate transport system permease component
MTHLFAQLALYLYKPDTVVVSSFIYGVSLCLSPVNITYLCLFKDEKQEVKDKKKYPKVQQEIIESYENSFFLKECGFEHFLILSFLIFFAFSVLPLQSLSLFFAK